MTETSWPFFNQDTSEAQYTQLMRHFSRSGVLGLPSGTDLKVFADSTGMQVKVPTGFAVVRGLAYNNAAQKTLAIGVSNTNPRRDLIVLRLNPDADNILLTVLPGVAAASPVDPALTQTDTGVFDIPLARVTVDANASTIAANKITDMRPFVGKDWGVWTTTNRPLNPTILDAGFNQTTGRPEYWSGTAWTEFFPASLTASMITDPQNLVAGDTDKVDGKNVFIQATQPAAPGTANALWIW